MSDTERTPLPYAGPPSLAEDEVWSEGYAQHEILRLRVAEHMKLCDEYASAAQVYALGKGIGPDDGVRMARGAVETGARALAAAAPSPAIPEPSGVACNTPRRGDERLCPDCNPRHRPNRRQIIYALERQAHACIAQAEALERPGDPYAGLMLREDAELLEQAIALLRGSLTSGHAVTPYSPVSREQAEEILRGLEAKGYGIVKLKTTA